MLETVGASEFGSGKDLKIISGGLKTNLLD